MRNHIATERSARFSARVPGIGHGFALCTTSTSSRFAARRASCSCDMRIEVGLGDLRWVRRLGRVRRPGAVAVPSGAGSAVGSGGAHAFAPSQIAIPIIAVRPTTKATMPSAVGPMPPAA